MGDGGVALAGFIEPQRDALIGRTGEPRLIVEPHEIRGDTL
jgi:hypothetical protein